MTDIAEYVKENTAESIVYIVFGLLCLLGIAFFGGLIPAEDNFEIKNGKVIQATFKKFLRSKSMQMAVVDYTYNGYYYSTRASLSCECYVPGQKILVKIDTMDAELFAFMPDTFIAEPTLTDSRIGIAPILQTDTVEAIELDYFRLAQCLKFYIIINGRKIQMEKLVKEKPRSDRMLFIYYNKDINENYLINE